MVSDLAAADQRSPRVAEEIILCVFPVNRFGYQTTVLFALDGLANLVDFAYHFWMGRALAPPEFAALQTLNSLALVYVTSAAVFQPVIARFVAEARSRGQESEIPSIFRSFLSAAFWLGLALMLLVLAFSAKLAGAFHLPEWTIHLSAALIFLGSLRPVAAGVLQGRENFIRYGLTRLLLALGRILLAVFLVQAGYGLFGAVIALPFGWLVSVLAALLFLGRPVWRRLSRLPNDLPLKSWRLSLFALLGFLAFMSLSSLDLIWVNRSLTGDQSGAYASLVLLRRVVALLPGVAVIVMYPRISLALSARAGQPHAPAIDRLLARTAALILAAGGALTLLYFTFGDRLILLVFGEAYRSAAPLLGWMAAGMTGLSLGALWLNYYLAEKPALFVVLLVLAAIFEWTALTLSAPSLAHAALVFSLTGWLLALGGLALYLLKSRPALARVDG